MAPGESVRSVISCSQVLATFAVSLCCLVAGFTLAYTSPALPSMMDRSQTSFEVSEQQGSWVGGIMPLAGLVGAIVGGPLIAVMGRKLTILLSAIPFFVGWLLIGFAYSVEMVLGGRTIGGLAGGVTSVAMPIYLGESLHPKVRGALGLLPTLLANFGLFVCYTVGWVTNWSQLAFVGSGFCIPYFFLMLLIPESPRWYMARDKEEKAAKALTWLRKKDADIDAELEKVRNAKAVDKATWGELLKKRNCKPILISLGLMFFQQFCGINALYFYTVMIFDSAGSSVDSHISTVIIGAVNFLSTIAASYYIDHLGRKVLLFISAFSMVITLFVLTGYFYCKAIGMNVSSVGWLPLVCFIIYVMGFSVGFGPIPWLMLGEILPDRVRGSGAALVVSFNKGCTFVSAKTYQDTINWIGIHGTFGSFFVICLLSIIFICVVPETKNKTLEQIEEEMAS